MIGKCDQADNAFGPTIRGCRDDTDFTLLFEQSFFSLVPASCFLLSFIYRYVQLAKRRRVLEASLDWLILAKLIAAATLGSLQIALIVLYTLPHGELTKVSLPSACLNFLATLGLAGVSYQEHHRSLRPSFYLCGYLAISTLLDTSQARTLWLRESHRPIAILFFAIVALKLITLFLESIQKRRLLQSPYTHYSPDALGSIFNRSVFWWLNSLLLRGSLHAVQQEDLPPLDPRLASETVSRRIEDAWNSCNKDSKYSLLWITLKVASRSLLSAIFPRICLIGFNIAQPLLMYRVISYIDQATNAQTKFVGQALIGAACLVYLGIAISTAAYKHQTYRCIVMIRGGLLSLIYNSTLQLSTSELTDQSVLTLMSEDFDRIAAAFENSDVIWASPIEVGLALYILYREIGLACLAPVVFVIGCAASVHTLSKWAKKAQHRWMEAVQDRVSSTSYFLKNIKNIRMSGISEPSSLKVDDLRVKELEKSKRFRQNAVTRMTIGVLPETMAPAAAFIVYALIAGNNGLNPAKAFSALSLLSLLSKPMLNFMYAFPVFVASLGSYDRIQKYLLTGEGQDQRASFTATSKPEQKDFFHKKRTIADVEAIRLDNFDSTNLSQPSKTLVWMENASFTFASTKEPVLKNVSLEISRGTSSLLLGPVGSGKSALLLALLGELIQVDGGTVILPGSGVAYCSQQPWLPNSSIRNVIIGPSNFDETWYQEVIKACCLDTDISLLPQKDMTTVGSKGVSLSGGQRQRIALARAIYSRKHLLLLDDVTSGLDNTTESQLVERLLGHDGICRKYGLTVVLATHKIQFKSLVDTIITIDPESSTLKVQRSDRIPSSPRGDYQVEQEVTSVVPGPNTLEEEDIGNNNTLSDLSRRTGDFSLYSLYAKEMRVHHIILFVLASIGFCFFSRFPNIWLEWWSEEQIEYPGHTSTRYIAGYAGFGVSSTICFFLVYWIFLVESVPHTSVCLHRKLLNIVTAAPLSTLLSIDTGVLLNRFAQDMSLIDMRLPGAMIQVLDGALDMIAEFVLVAESSPWTALTFPPLFVILYVLQKFYLNTSRQIRYLDLEAKSPLFSSFLETCDGISTIRGFGWQESFRQRNMHLTDESQKPFYLMYSIQCWLTLVLNLLVMGIVVVLITVAVQLRGTSGGALGVALNNVSAISSTLTYVIQAWTSLETSMGALARLKSFEAETPSEHLPQECHIPASSWPSEGRIEFVDISLSYRADLDSVVRGINLTISPGTKIGICGRSGSGKSSLILGLLRLNEITKGRILVDNLDISQIPRETIRQNIAALPQDPLILPGSIRTNIDPLEAYDDQEIISTISRVGLSNWLLSQESGLDSIINQETLSAGQQQLITFARILLKPKTVTSSIRLFDEVTSMVDMETEATMMRLIREESQGCTVIAVAHRLKTILDFDQVLVMDHGVIVESGNPAELLQDPESWFSRLCIKQDSA